VVALLAAALSVAAASARSSPKQPKIRALRAVADAYVTAASRSANFGRMRALRVDRVPVTRAYVRFEGRYLKGDVKRINLLVYSRTASRVGFRVRVVSGRWLEGGITYANAPQLPTRFIASGPLRRMAWKAIDVTKIVGGEDDEVSLALTTVAPGGLELGSRESGLTGPRLVIERMDNSGPSSTESVTTDSSR
jgi:hypothetical protein